MKNLGSEYKEIFVIYIEDSVLGNGWFQVYDTLANRAFKIFDKVNY